MKLSPTSYEAFWACPERYRLSRLVVPAEKPAALREGGAFHAAVEAYRKGWNPERIVKMLYGQEPAPDNSLLDLGHDEAFRVSAWFESWKNHTSETEAMLAVEAWYEVPLGTDEVTGEPHVLYGRVDGIVQHEGVPWVHEIKTRGLGSADALVREARTEWPRKMQLRAETLGAQALGFSVAGVMLELVSKLGTHACVRVPIRYTQQELDAARSDLLHTAQTITIMQSVSPDGPWPHPATAWPCKKLGACDYESVCMRPGAPEPDGFVWVKPTRPVPDAKSETHEAEAIKEAVAATPDDPAVVRVA